MENQNEPSYLGAVSAVSGASVTIELAPHLDSGLVIIGGKTHRIGQVGSFIRIPQGYNSLYGIISETSETSVLVDDSELLATKRRWIKVELVGEAVDDEFERGIGQYPGIGDDAHIVVEEDLKLIYGNHDAGNVIIGKLSSSDSIDVSIDLEKLVTRHSAVLGSTGSGKSTSVSSLLRSITCDDNDKVRFPSSRIILIDIHGEYSSALGDIATVFSVNPQASEKKLVIPYWCISPDSLVEFLCGKMSSQYQNLFVDKMMEQKLSFIEANKNKKNIKSLNLDRISAQTPIPFRLKKVWFDLAFDDSVVWNEKEKETPAYKSDDTKGSAEAVVAPEFKAPGTGSAPPFKGGDNTLRKYLELFRSRLLDKQYSFLLSPDDWEPNVDNEINADLDELVKSWIGHDKPVTILDLSGIPSASLEQLLGSLLDILFESALWGRNLKEGMKERPLLMVLEEAHRYLSNENSGFAKLMVRRIAKEGRKFGLGLMLVSQRPSEIDETILSQCGTLFALRINNNSDRSRVKAAMSDGVSGIVDSLPVLRTGEAIVVGESAKLPMRCRFRLPRNNRFPDSVDPDVVAKWQAKLSKEDYEHLVAVWRNKDSFLVKQEDVDDG